MMDIARHSVRLALFCLVLFSIAGCSSLDRATESSSETQLSVPTDLSSVLDQRQADRSVGYVYFLNDVQLEPGPGKDLVYAVGAKGNRMLVMLHGRDKVKFREGQRFDVRGSLQLPPAAASLREEWKLTKKQAAQISSEKVYLDASSVSAAN
ncbi:MAG TPA: hypothetical protein VLT16_13420 [Candidatus Limnocylindrales bacterium]|nr:hypothetical protein [Candidatus Limnocylindrales bacterium]